MSPTVVIKQLANRTPIKLVKSRLQNPLRIWNSWKGPVLPPETAFTFIISHPTSCNSTLNNRKTATPVLLSLPTPITNNKPKRSPTPRPSNSFHNVCQIATQTWNTLSKSTRMRTPPVRRASKLRPSCKARPPTCSSSSKGNHQVRKPPEQSAESKLINFLVIQQQQTSATTDRSLSAPKAASRTYFRRRRRPFPAPNSWPRLAGAVPLAIIAWRRTGRWEMRRRQQWEWRKDWTRQAGSPLMLLTIIRYSKWVLMLNHRDRRALTNGFRRMLRFPTSAKSPSNNPSTTPCRPKTPWQTPAPTSKGKPSKTAGAPATASNKPPKHPTWSPSSRARRGRGRSMRWPTPKTTRFSWSELVAGAMDWVAWCIIRPFMGRRTSLRTAKSKNCTIWWWE